MRSYVLSDDDGQIFPAHSISAGLDYPGACVSGSTGVGSAADGNSMLARELCGQWTRSRPRELYTQLPAGLA